MISSLPKWVGSLFGNAMRPNVKVATTSYISPQIKKIRFKGDISKWDFKIGYASVVRVSETAFRNYTIAHHDLQNGTFDLIIHLHRNGVGSQCMDALQTNDELFISPPRGKVLYDPSLKQQLFFGDETSLGVAVALLPLLKKNHHQFQFYFELDDVNNAVPDLLGLEHYLIFPKDNSFGNENWINTLPLLQTQEWNTAHFALTGNVKSVQAFRKVIKSKTEGAVRSQGYWLEGKKGL